MVSSLFGSSKPKVQQVKPESVLKPFTAGGISGRFDQGVFNVTASPERQALISGLQSTLGSQAGVLRSEFLPRFEQIFGAQNVAIGDLLSRVRPGFSELREARDRVFGEQLNRFRDTSRGVVSDIRGNLEQRRLSGASFAQDVLARAEAEFLREENALVAARAEAEALSTLEELELTNNLINQQLQVQLSATNSALELLNSAFTLDVKAQEAELDELNTLASTASQLINTSTSSFSALAQQQQQLAAQAASGQGNLLGTLLGGGGGLFGSIGRLGDTIFGGGDGGGSTGETIADIAKIAAAVFL